MQLAKMSGLSGQQMVTFFDASLILSLRRKVPPLLPLEPPHTLILYPPLAPPASDPVGCFDVRNQSLLLCRHDGNGGFTVIPHLIQSSHHQITSKPQQEAATLKRNPELPFSLACEIFLCAPLKFSWEKKRLLFSRNLS